MGLGTRSGHEQPARSCPGEELQALDQLSCSLSSSHTSRTLGPSPPPLREGALAHTFPKIPCPALLINRHLWAPVQGGKEGVSCAKNRHLRKSPSQEEALRRPKSPGHLRRSCPRKPQLVPGPATRPLPSTQPQFLCLSQACSSQVPELMFLPKSLPSQDLSICTSLSTPSARSSAQKPPICHTDATLGQLHPPEKETQYHSSSDGLRTSPSPSWGNSSGRE